MNIDFTIDREDITVLLVHTRNAYPKHSLEEFFKEVQEDYSKYYKRNMNNIERYGVPKTFSQWVNGQIIALT